MSETDYKQAALDAWNSFSTGESEKIKAAFTSDAGWFAPPLNATAVGLGYTHHLTSPDMIADFIVNRFRQMYVDDVAIEITGVFADGPMVVIEQRLTATLVNGRHYENDYCFVLEMHGSRIRLIREYMDTRKGYEMVFGNRPPGPLC
jgi:hypothetical protein